MPNPGEMVVHIRADEITGRRLRLSPEMRLRHLSRSRPPEWRARRAPLEFATGKEPSSWWLLTLVGRAHPGDPRVQTLTGDG